MPLTTNDYIVLGNLSTPRIELAGQDLMTQTLPQYLTLDTSVGTYALYYTFDIAGLEVGSVRPGSSLMAVDNSVSTPENLVLSNTPTTGSWRLVGIVLYTKIKGNVAICGNWVRVL